MFDPDDFIDPDKKAEIAELDKLLSKLQDCDLGAWDQDFVDDMVKRLSLFTNRFRITSPQWEQLERMRTQYGVTEGRNRYKGPCGYKTYRVHKRNNTEE